MLVMENELGSFSPSKVVCAKPNMTATGNINRKRVIPLKTLKEDSSIISLTPQILSVLPGADRMTDSFNGSFCSEQRDEMGDVSSWIAAALVKK